MAVLLSGLTLLFPYGIALHRLGFMRARRKCKRPLLCSLGLASLACFCVALAPWAVLPCGCGGASSMRGAWEVARAKGSSQGLWSGGTVLSLNLPARARMWLPPHGWQSSSVAMLQCRGCFLSIFSHQVSASGSRLCRCCAHHTRRKP